MMDRRDFIKKTTLAAAGAAITSPVSAMLANAESGKTLKVLLVNGSPRNDGNTFCCRFSRVQAWRCHSHTPNTEYDV